MPELIITIAPGGDTKIEVDGVQGTSCTDLTREIENRLGSVQSRNMKGDYFAQEHQEGQYLGQG